METWNATEIAYPKTSCVHELLEAQARLTPGAIAVEFDGQSLTYSELQARANQLARALQRRGVQRENLVGVCLNRSLETVVGVLGILKAGAAYVPLDPSYPPDRIRYVLEDAGVKLMVTHATLLDSVPAGCDSICLDRDRESMGRESTEAVASGVAPSNLAYVIYTSGSTGKPKGVQIEHRSVVNFICSMQREPGLDAKDVLVAVTTLAFDIAGLEIFLPLSVGARVVIASRDDIYDGRRLMRLLEQSRATVMQATPVTWRLLFESGWQGDGRLKVLVGGEALPSELARDLANRCGVVWNMYGPTETTIWSSVYRVEKNTPRTIPIGKPIGNTKLYILDADCNRLPVGSEGELYIGGDGLARGYFERPDLTAEKFVHDPFSNSAGARMYRTGDLARFRPDGDVEFLGRIDHQVKIRGFRIELGEIETVLEQHGGVQKGVVGAREDDTGATRLVAYFVPKPEAVVTLAALREHLSAQLPDYMVPSAFVQLDALPLTPNGKVDRKALPAPKPSDFQNNLEYVAPRNDVEKKLVSLWEEVLDIRPIGITTSFFDLGGRSLLAARLFTGISRVFGKELPLSTLFQAPTIEQLAAKLDATAEVVAYKTIVSIKPSGSLPPIFCVHGGAGGALFMHRLARLLDADQPFYGIEPEGLDGGRFERTTIEQIAAHYIAEMRKIQPAGPYYIGGYCFGGLVAFEMAQQLQRQGQEAALVAMLSAELRYNRLQPTRIGRASAAKQAPSRLESFLRSPFRAVAWRVLKPFNALRTAARLKTCEISLALGLKVPQALRTFYVATMLFEAEKKYKPRPYSGTLTLFAGQGAYEHDPDMGWGGLAGSFERYAIGDGDASTRRDIMNEPLVEILARELTGCLQSSRTKIATSAVMQVAEEPESAPVHRAQVASAGIQP